MSLKELADDQHKRAWRWFPGHAEDLKHHVLGMVGEAGEVANLVKKWDRGDFEFNTPIDKEDSFSVTTYREIIGEEVIDVLIYVLNVCAILGIDPDEVLEQKNEFNESRFGRRISGTIDSDTEGRLVQ
jgi:NTP pyrophosphatase (non-canonical NTP hydrolase)